MRYAVWSYDWSEASAGPKVLHRLCHELNAVGQEASVGPGWTTNPEWDAPSLPVPSGDWCAVYPEIVPGNPWAAPRVARWVLNVPGLLGGDRAYAPSERVFTWHRSFLDAPVLRLPVYRSEYREMLLPRSGALVWVGKGRRTEAVEGREITYAERLDPSALADALNRAEVLHSFDPVSGMNDIARLCGCPVLLHPGGFLPGDSAAVRAEVDADLAAFPGQLAAFVEATA